MASKVGYKWLLKIVAAGGVMATDGKTLGIARDVDLDSDADVVDTSSREGAGVKNFEYGLSSWTSSAKALWVPTNLALVLLQTAHFNKTKVDVVFQESATAGDKQFSGTALVTKFKVGQPLNGEVMYEINLQGDGALTPGTVS